MIKTVNGYKYATLEAFRVVADHCNMVHGIGTNPNSTTTEWLSYNISYKEDLETIDFYYINVYEDCIGETTEFDIRLPNEEII